MGHAHYSFCEPTNQTSPKARAHVDGGAPRAALQMLPNLHGDIYAIANAPGASTQLGRHGAASFEVQSVKITTRYADVVHHNERLALPAAVALRFKGKSMAVTGYELSYMLLEEQGRERRMPWPWLYNHHHRLWINREWFSEGNGGETFASFKGYPKGTAQLVYSPSLVAIEAMAIDIRNRDPPHVNISGRIVPGPLPQGVPAGHAFYTPLFECPCTNRTLPLKRWHRQGCPSPLKGNTACSRVTYRGGSLCCGPPRTVLLDHDQPQPQLPMTFRIHVRVWYEEFTAQPTPTHAHLLRAFLSVEQRHFEYDVPGCRPGTPPHECTHTVSGQYSLASQLRRQGVESEEVRLPPNSTTFELVYAAAHCHAPSCLSMELFHEDRLLCGVRPEYGPQTGGDYLIRINPCLWGDDVGLLPRVVLPLGAALKVVKVNNNTVPHRGEMATFQMRVVVAGAFPRGVPHA